MIKHVKDKTVVSLSPQEYFQLKEVLIVSFVKSRQKTKKL
jgi:hypothetical protein